MTSVKIHQDKSQCNVICQKKLAIYILVYFINAKNLFKVPNTHFKSQIYKI